MLGSDPAEAIGSARMEEVAEAIRAAVEAGGSRFERLVLTRNRRIMASVADHGKTLRLHESFRHAPPETLQAIGRLFSGRSPAVRSRARAIVREYVTTTLDPSTLTARPRATSPPSPHDRRHLDRLMREFETVNATFFDAALPAVEIRISGRMRRRLGHFCSDPLEIAISRMLCERGTEGEAAETLRHEMIHLWQWHSGRRVGHGADFRRWARTLGVTARATRLVDWASSGTFACHRGRR